MHSTQRGRRVLRQGVHVVRHRLRHRTSRVLHVSQRGHLLHETAQVRHKCTQRNGPKVQEGQESLATGSLRSSHNAHHRQRL